MPPEMSAMLTRLALPLLLLILAALPVAAEPRLVGPLLAAQDFDRLIAIMRQEGIDHGHELEAEFFADPGGARWRAAVETIHDPARMKAIVTEVLDREMTGHEADLAAATAFFTADPGRRIVALELSAREALMDDATREAAELAFEEMQAGGTPRVMLLDRFVEANDLIDSNVSDAMNSNLAFYRGLLAAGGLDPGVAERDMLSDLWAQEQQIRDETVVWVYPYLAMAYDTLTDAELQAYIDFSLTPAGQRLNRAQFAAFGALFEVLSHDLGLAVGKQLQGQDI